MHFDNTHERRMMSEVIDRFVATRYDFATRDAIARSPQGCSADVWWELADLGIIGALFDPRDHGYGGSGFDVAAVFERLGRGLVVEPLLDTLMVGQAIAHAGSAAQSGYLAEMIRGRHRIALAHDEPGAHHALEHVTVRADKVSDGWRLVGAKSVVHQPSTADMFLVSARTSGVADDRHGISLFLVPRAAHGLSSRDYPCVDGGRVGDIALSAVTVPIDAVVGSKDEAIGTLEYAVGYGVLALCAEAFGIMEVALGQTLDYLRTRRQFDAPLGQFQALQHRMADLWMEIEQARSAVINAAAAMGSERVVRERALSAAKYTTGRVGILVAEECIQLHGGIGMTWELPLSHYAKRLVMIDHQLGDMDQHLERYMALGRC